MVEGGYIPRFADKLLDEKLAHARAADAIQRALLQGHLYDIAHYEIEGNFRLHCTARAAW